MTGKRKNIRLEAVLASVRSSPLKIDMQKSSRGAVTVISGIMSISEISENEIELVSHSGRVVLLGDSLGVTVLENRSVEIYGRITEVRLTYGKT